MLLVIIEIKTNIIIKDTSLLLFGASSAMASCLLLLGHLISPKPPFPPNTHHTDLYLYANFLHTKFMLIFNSVFFCVQICYMTDL